MFLKYILISNAVHHGIFLFFKNIPYMGISPHVILRNAKRRGHILLLSTLKAVF